MPEMSRRERILCATVRKQSDRLPFFHYWRHSQMGRAERECRNRGMGLCWTRPCWIERMHGVGMAGRRWPRHLRPAPFAHADAHDRLDRQRGGSVLLSPLRLPGSGRGSLPGRPEVLHAGIREAGEGPPRQRQAHGRAHGWKARHPEGPHRRDSHRQHRGLPPAPYGRPPGK